MATTDSMKLPPYLKRCYRFPRAVEDREDDWCSPSRRRHRKCWGRAFELSLSYEAVVETEGATELFRFLSDDYIAAKDEDAKEDKDDEGVMSWVEGNYGLFGSRKIVWMSETVFIFAIPCLRSINEFHGYFDQGASKVYSIQLYNDCEQSEFYRVGVILQPTAKTVKQASVLESGTISCRSVEEINAMDVLLRLVANYKHVTYVEIRAHPQYGRDLGTTRTTEFPASMDALKSFVGKVRTARTVCLHRAGLSLEQWHEVTRNCSKTVSIMLNYYAANDDDPIDRALDRELDRERSAFIEAAIQDHCPSKIVLCNLDLAPADKRQILLSALESTALLEELDVFFDVEKRGDLLVYVDAISCNRGFQRLKFTFGLPFPSPRLDLPHAVWERFCGAIASHPTLHDLDVEYFSFSPPSRAIEQDQEVLIRMICQNTVLRKVAIDYRLLCDENSFYEAIDPVLEFNRFRQVAQSIKQEAEPARRIQWFTATLSSKPVRKGLAHRFLLLKENFDMLVDMSEQVRLMRRGRGTDIPSSLKETEITRLARKRKQEAASLA